ncbi:hypothetical protein BDZ88DRAFT_278952 [Geranomyces variabilis]|nr:hypothetical protein BDZ88DRAFT_278952 [Geranomyces variabilis]KAJ3142393.1 hypothetical protein HDU90_004666 [Geranomyces variabilis]
MAGLPSPRLLYGKLCSFQISNQHIPVAVTLPSLAETFKQRHYDVICRRDPARQGCPPCRRRSPRGLATPAEKARCSPPSTRPRQPACAGTSELGWRSSRPRRHAVPGPLGGYGRRNCFATQSRDCQQVNPVGNPDLVSDADPMANVMKKHNLSKYICETGGGRLHIPLRWQKEALHDRYLLRFARSHRDEGPPKSHKTELVRRQRGINDEGSWRALARSLCHSYLAVRRNNHEAQVFRHPELPGISAMACV